METEKLSSQSIFVLDYFKSKNLQRTTFKNDPNLEKKLAGIQDAINAGYLRTKINPINKSIYVSATNKLTETYNF